MAISIVKKWSQDYDTHTTHYILYNEKGVRKCVSKRVDKKTNLETFVAFEVITQRAITNQTKARAIWETMQ